MSRIANQDVAASSNVLKLTRAHLPQVSVKAAMLARRFYRSAPRRAGDLCWRWCPQPTSAPQSLATLRCGEYRVVLALDSNVPLDAHSTSEWRAHRGDMRRLAFAAAHDTLIEQLQGALGGELVVEAVDQCGDGVDRGDISPDAHLTLGFTLSGDADAVVASGQIAMPRRCAVRAARQLERATRTPTAVPLPLQFQVEVDRFALPASALSDLTDGCVVRLTNYSLTQPTAGVLLTAGHWQLPADVRERTLQLRRIDPMPTCPIPVFSTGDKPMTESTSNAGASVADLGALPVQLRFCAGNITLSLADAQSLQPGQMLALERDLEQSPITVYANDVAVARGDLVLIGDVLGVRITRTLHTRD